MNTPRRPRGRNALAAWFGLLAVLALARGAMGLTRHGIDGLGPVQWAWLLGGLACAAAALIASRRASSSP